MSTATAKLATIYAIHIGRVVCVLLLVTGFRAQAQTNSTVPCHRIAVAATQFTLDGTLFPYTGISFFNAIYNPTFNASSGARRGWLKKFQSYGINVLRVWCQWDNARGFVDASPTNTMFEADGGLRPTPLATLKAILADADQFGMCLEIVIFAQESYDEKLRLAPPSDERAVAALTRELKAFRNATFQIWNEHSDTRVMPLLKAIKTIDPQRLVSNSPGYGGDLGSDEENAALDYLSPHTTRTGRHWETAPRELAGLREKFGKPVVDDEPARKGISRTGGPETATSPFDHIVQILNVWHVGAYPTYHPDMFQTGYGTPAVPPSGIPDPEFNPYHRTVFDFLARRDRFLPVQTTAEPMIRNSVAHPVEKADLRVQFKNPPFEYRAYFPFQGAGGRPYQGSTNIQGELENIYTRYGFGGIMFSPTTDKPFLGTGNLVPGYVKHVGNGLQVTNPAGSCPWLMTLPPGLAPYKYEANEGIPEDSNRAPLPAYLSRAYFDRLKEILAYSKKRGRKVVFYDEIGYPSGIANHTTPEKYNRKLLTKTEEIVSGPNAFHKVISRDGALMAVVAMNCSTLERIDLTPTIKNNLLGWKVPLGAWKVMVFECIAAKTSKAELDYRAATDYLDPEAVGWFLNAVYEPHAREAGEYFGKTIIQTYFDDVGIFDEERTWTTKFNMKFKQRIGLNPATYYPALWENIGSETDAARTAFFDTRAELLADGFPKVVTDWGKRHHIEVSGHCPGNYDPQPVDMNGDPFKFYRAQPIPMADVIFAYPTGRNGFKLVSDGADYYDKPIVAAETFSAFSPPGTKAGYRRMMELYIRGINRLLGSGFPKSDEPGGPTAFAEWVGRHSLLLQGGRRISEIALFYPIADLEAFYHFDAPKYTKDMRWGSFVPHDNDFLAVGEMLLGQAHRDFTFLHPDFLLSDQIKVHGSSLELANKVNHQSFKVLILPGQTVISLRALEKIRTFYDEGGVVVATSLLPSKSAELTGNSEKTVANDRNVQSIIKDMFGVDSSQPMPEEVSSIRTNEKHGRTVFIRQPSGKLIADTLDRLNIFADVVFDGNPTPSSGGGLLSYIHKQKNDRDIYFFANSSDDPVETFAKVRGRIRPELWDPATGEVNPITQVEYSRSIGQDYTRFPLKMKAVTSLFVVSAK